QAANWNAYREKLAAMAGETPAMDEPGDQSAAGKVTTKVEDAMPAATEPAKEVLKLSKGESGAAAAGGNGKAAADRVRALEEEVAAKDRAVKDANERVASLEKTIKDMQALMEMKSQGMSDLQKPAADKVPPAKTEAPVAAPAPTPAPEPAPEAAAPTEEQPAIATMPEPEPAPAPAPKKIVPPPPPPPPPPSFLDQILADPTYVVGAGAALALVGGGALLYLLRKKRAGGDVPPKKKKKGKKGAAEAEEGDAIAEDGGPTTDDELPASQLAAAGDAHEDGDPLAEAEIFLTYGRDNLAEDRLREAIAANPRRFELHAKLLEIYANRQDLVAFEQVAKELQIGTASKGDLWARAVRLGYSLDPGNPRYAAGRPAEGEVAAAAVGGAALAAGALDASKTNLDFNLGFDDGGSGTTTDIDLGELGPDIRAASSVGTPTDIDLGELGGPGGGDIFDPGIGMQPPVDHESTVQMTSFGGSGNTMDLGGLDLTGDIFPDESTSAAAPQPTTSSSPAELDFDLDAAPTSVSGEPSDPDGGLAFDLSGLDLDAPAAGSGAPGAANMPDLDLSGINLDLDGTGSGTATGGKDDKWYDVQTKFDLAKAYQEMGDKEGAREILQEVVAEGDAEQKSAAQSVLASLG
ncbi:MAG: hypothetical protein KIT73_15610, partial [Burkholderiales bacterium]|nr:hypothetical protein [Burkholderiales bacterium]